MRISFSLLETYKNCPLKFKYQQLDKIKTPKNIEAVFGNAIHSSLKKLFERTPLFPSLDEVIDHFQNNFAEKVESLNLEPDTIAAYTKEGITLLKNFYKKNPPWNFNVVELESRFSVILEDPENKETHILAGIIDRIDKHEENGAYEIIDYKTSKRMPSQDDTDKNLQLSIYNLGLLKKWPHLDPEKIKLSLYFLKHGEKAETKRTKEDLENTKTEILKTIREIEDLIKKEKEFIPTPSGLCDWCGYQKMCPMWRHLFQSQISNLPATRDLAQRDKSQKDQIPALINKYLELDDQTSQNKRRLAEIKAQIDNFMSQEDITRVFGENAYFTRISQEKEVFDSKKAQEALKKMGKLKEFLKKRQFSTLRLTKKKIKP
ncbi:MAG: hypothetical protein COT67_01215 [Candidatus Tagabacteria bacterium CG09_land_8_20_14_0_10_41_14]|uniref:PD-(D/E)XK endonuclease-like domain-containing protein n=1 Tax=Candidatus Tagabacteria bacterium CG09_land_8_20_14_0_10_41_14 TaxID=1975021 RepID=A0A2H0WLM3_9BACT|nr:MAG: hypothetical protein COT67_01215 [Candidatus Tagabacteria bacterium CG09_land_8_20_14_0_10_41_14]